MNYSIRETHLQANSSKWVYQQTLYSKWAHELPTELEALKESPELTVKIKLFLT